MVTLIKPAEPITIRPSAEPVTIRPSNVIRVFPIAAVRIEPAAQQVVTVFPVRPAVIRPPQRGAWDERGWSRRSANRRDVYEGSYVVGSRRFRGRIEVEGAGRRITAYIHNPPTEIKRHRHGACFQQAGNGTGWFILHWRRPATNVDDAILYMERTLDESLSS